MNNLKLLLQNSDMYKYLFTECIPLHEIVYVNVEFRIIHWKMFNYTKMTQKLRAYIPTISDRIAFTSIKYILKEE